MIYIHRDWSKVPDEVKAALKTAADELDALADPAARKAYIKDHATKWTAVREHLSGMSDGKCWYSEAREAVSRYHVDHFRPHGRSKQAVATYADGYCWLAFEIENYRLAGMLCNTVNEEYSDDSVGKGDWFPLLDPAMRATVAARNISRETPVLLDPTEPDDPAKLWFNDDGNIVPDPDLDDDTKLCVETAIQCLGLRQSMLNRLRLSAIRRCLRSIRRYKEVARMPKGVRTKFESDALEEARSELLAMSAPGAEFAAAVRCCLISNGLKGFVTRDELRPIALSPADV